MTVSTHSSVNQLCSTMGLSWAVLRSALLAAGWTQQGSGDGTTFSNSAAGPVTGGGTGVAGLDGTGRWIRLQDPDAKREIIIQRAASATAWTMVYSYSARFTGGSPSATVAPTATDQQSLFTSATFATSAAAYTHAVVEDAAINGVWGFWLYRTTQTTSVRLDLIACDPLSSGTDESRYGVLGSAIDPCVWMIYPNTATPAIGVTSYTVPLPTTQVNVFLANPGTGAAQMLHMTACRLDQTGSGITLADATTAPNGTGVSGYDGGDDLIAALWCRFSAISNGNPGTTLGISHHLSLKTIPARQYPDVVQHGTSDLAWVYYNTVALPWPKGTTPSA